MLFDVREAFDPVMTRCGAALLDDIKELHDVEPVLQICVTSEN
jgi:hypothetical protein